MVNLAGTTLRAHMSWRRVDYILSVIAGGVLMVAALLTVADVSGRYLFNRPITGAVESVQLMLPYAVFLAFAYALVTGNHVQVTLILERLPPKLRLWADIFACLVGLFVLGLLSYFGSRYFLESFKVNEFINATIYLPAWAGKFAMPVGLSVFLIQFSLRLLVNLGRLAKKIEVAEEVIQEKQKLAE